MRLPIVSNAAQKIFLSPYIGEYLTVANQTKWYECIPNLILRVGIQSMKPNS